MGYPIVTREICNVLNVNKLQNEQFFRKYLIIKFIRKTTGDDKIPHYLLRCIDNNLGYGGW